MIFEAIGKFSLYLVGLVVVWFIAYFLVEFVGITTLENWSEVREYYVVGLLTVYMGCSINTILNTKDGFFKS